MNYGGREKWEIKGSFRDSEEHLLRGYFVCHFFFPPDDVLVFIYFAHVTLNISELYIYIYNMLYDIYIYVKEGIKDYN